MLPAEERRARAQSAVHRAGNDKAMEGGSDGTRELIGNLLYY